MFTEDPVSEQRIQFANSNRYIVAGTGPINLDSGTMNIQGGIISANGTIDGDLYNAAGTISPDNRSTVSDVPEPSSLLLFTLGGYLLGLLSAAHVLRNFKRDCNAANVLAKHQNGYSNRTT